MIYDPPESKPPYRVPSMAEIAATPRCGLSLVSFFSGAGGSCLGFRMAGYRVLYASEFVAAARETYLANKSPETIVDDRDIRDVEPGEILARCGLGVGEVDVVEGSPPCSSFSTAGRRQQHWGAVKKYSDVRQRTDDLFEHFVRMVDGIAPRAFVAENVSGLVKGVAKGFFVEILAALKVAGPGYRVRAQVLDAQWLGVPQQRQRVIFVGVRSDLMLDPVFPDPLPYRYSVREAIPWIAGLRGGNKAPFDGKGRPLSVDAPSPAVLGGDLLGLAPHQFEVDAEIVYKGQPGGKPWAERRRSIDGPSAAVTKDGYGGAARHQAAIVEAEADIGRYAIGAEADKLHPGQQSSKYFNLVRAPLDGPSPTITGQGAQQANSIASVVHPTERRKFSIAELKRICAFPDDFALTGTYAQQWERLGRAVPPPMMRAVAEALRDGVLLRGGEVDEDGREGARVDRGARRLVRPSGPAAPVSGGAPPRTRAPARRSPARSTTG